jgi:hypothetical protein
MTIDFIIAFNIIQMFIATNIPKHIPYIQVVSISAKAVISTLSSVTHINELNASSVSIKVFLEQKNVEYNILTQPHFSLLNIEEPKLCVNMQKKSLLTIYIKICDVTIYFISTL